MRSAYILVTLTLLACGEPKLPDRPVDMQFRVTTEQLENSCGDAHNYKPAEGYTAVIDVFMRSNGRVNVSNRSAYIPGRRVYEDIVLKDGRIDHKMKVPTSTDGVTVEHSLHGVITPESIDVTLTVHDRNWGRDGSDCLRKTRLSGDARPLFDPTKHDGTWQVTVEDYGFACPAEPARQKIGSSATLLEVDHYMPGKAGFSLGQLGWNAFPDEQGNLEASFASVIGGFLEVEGAVKGNFLPGDLDFTLDWWIYGDPSGCSFQSRVKGTKRIPSRDSADNEYRVAFAMSDGCGLGLESSEKSVQLISLADGRIILVDPYLGGVEAMLSPLSAGGVISYTEGSVAQGEVLTVSGSYSPPRLDYAVEYKAETSPGTWCTIAYSAIGHARFVFP